MTITAAVLLIGNELLSGRTQDSNLAHIAAALNTRGIRIMEARVVADVHADIIAAVKALRARYTYVFTTGGIGPTHDDITTAAIAHAFEKKLIVDHAAVRALRTYYKITEDSELSAPRLKMATVPEGAELIPNPLTSAPGFRVENVFVLAGVPKIMQAMLEEILPVLASGSPMLSRSLTVPVGETRMAEALTAVQNRHPQVELGSYPTSHMDRLAVSLVLRSEDAQHLAAAEQDLLATLRALGVTDEQIERG